METTLFQDGSQGCACSIADPGINEPTSSCSGNTDGTVICDTLTLHCRAPRDLEPCAGTTCDTGYTCLPLASADGGAVPTCVQLCATGADCSSASTRCALLSDLGALPDAGGGSGCTWNLCGPGVDASSYFGTCDAADAGDGQCVPMPSADGGLAGTCIRTGALSAGDPCSSSGGECNLCAAGSMCGASGTSVPRDICVPLCDSSGSGPGCASPDVCAPFGVGQTTPNPGLCEPEAPGALEALGGTSYPARHGSYPEVVNSGGPIISAPHVVMFTYQQYDAGNVADYLDHLVKSDWIETTGADYGVGKGTFTQIQVGTTAPSGTIDDSAIQNTLSKYLKNPGLGVPPPDANTIYYFVYPPGVTITSGFEQSCSSFGGYHSEMTGFKTLTGTVNVIYAVIPDCGSFEFPGLDELGYMEVASSHELLEAASDPDYFSGPAWIMTDQSNPWIGLGGEIGDECAWNDIHLPFGWAQRIWSVSAAAVGAGSACVPLANEPDIEISAVSPSGSDEAYTAASGSEVTYTLTGWSTEPVQPFTISLVPFSNSRMTYSLDQTELSNGRQAHLKIKVPRNDSGDDLLLFVTATRPGQTLNTDDYWPIEVMVQ